MDHHLVWKIKFFSQNIEKTSSCGGNVVIIVYYIHIICIYVTILSFLIYSILLYMIYDIYIHTNTKYILYVYADMLYIHI